MGQITINVFKSGKNLPIPSATGHANVTFADVFGVKTYGLNQVGGIGRYTEEANLY